MGEEKQVFMYCRSDGERESRVGGTDTEKRWNGATEQKDAGACLFETGESLRTASCNDARLLEGKKEIQWFAAALVLVPCACLIDCLCLREYRSGLLFSSVAEVYLQRDHLATLSLSTLYQEIKVLLTVESCCRSQRVQG